MIIKMSLLDEETTKTLEVRSKEWKKKRYQELEKLTYKELQEIDKKLIENWKKSKEITDYDRGTLEVITDLNHSKYIKEFQKEFPKACVYYRKPYYL